MEEKNQLTLKIWSFQNVFVVAIISFQYVYSFVGDFKSS